MEGRKIHLYDIDYRIITIYTNLTTTTKKDVEKVDNRIEIIYCQTSSQIKKTQVEDLWQIQTLKEICPGDRLQYVG